MGKLEVTVENNTIHFFETGNRANNCLSISCQRTLRIPDDGKVYPLPPSLGSFPICKVDDYLDKVPDSWKQHGGVFLPMWQREAMWLKFDLNNSKAPKAIKVAVGKVNAITGESWDPQLHKSGNTQDYCVAPEQSWLDGINAGDGIIKQFVAMPLGSGYSVEAQVTGKEEFGGIQLMVVDSEKTKRDQRFPKPQQYAWPLNNSNAVTLTMGTSNRVSVDPVPMYNTRSVSVRWTRSSTMSSNSWLAVYLENTPSILFGSMWKYMSQQSGEFSFTVPSSGRYEIRAFANSSSYEPIANQRFDVIEQPNMVYSIPHYPTPILYPSDPFDPTPPPFEAVPCCLESHYSTECESEDFCSFDSADQFVSASSSVPVPQSTSFSSAPLRRQSSAQYQQQSIQQPLMEKAKEMGLSAGGSMKQKIVTDPYGLDFWDTNTSGRVYIHIVNSAMFKQITGRDPPATPISAQTYSSYGYKWFDKYEEGVSTVNKSGILSQVKTVKQIDQNKYAWPQQNDKSIKLNASQVYQTNPNAVRDGDW